MEALVEKERDAALGNGGLGRLAACFLDSMASLNLPAWGYGIRYQYGMFRQVLVDGFQHEQPDYWLNFGNPWELERSASVAYPISFYGHVSVHDDGGRQMFKWNPGETVTAVAYDTPFLGSRRRTPSTLGCGLPSRTESLIFKHSTLETMFRQSCPNRGQRPSHLCFILMIEHTRVKSFA